MRNKEIIQTGWYETTGNIPGVYFGKRCGRDKPVLVVDRATADFITMALLTAYGAGIIFAGGLSERISAALAEGKPKGEEKMDNLKPKPGELYIAQSPNKIESAGPCPWQVIRQGDGTLSNDTARLGIFWRKEYAELFLAALIAAPQQPTAADAAEGS